MKRMLLGVMPALVAVVVLGMQSGCGPGGPDIDAHPVSGTVTYNGSAVEGASVTFVPDAGGDAASGTTDASGNYTLNTKGVAGAPVGSYKVKIVRVQLGNVEAQPTVMGQDQDYGSGSYEGDAEKKAPAAAVQPLPEKYASETTSGFTATVAEGENSFDFALTD
jgi:hypothetical protein